jgi:hypothetical protein
VSTFSSKVQFLSSKTLANEVARLVAAHASVPVNEVGGERMNVSGSGAGANGSGGDAAAGLEADERQEKEEEEDEDAQQQGEMQDESDQEDGGDYVNEYGDDDEDGGGDAFGDDGGQPTTAERHTHTRARTRQRTGTGPRLPSPLCCLLRGPCCVFFPCRRRRNDVIALCCMPFFALLSTLFPQCLNFMSHCRVGQRIFASDADGGCPNERTRSLC